MENIKETSEGMFTMKWRNFIPLIISIVIGTNSMSIIYQNIIRNEQQIKYNKERADRISSRQLEEAKLYHDIQVLKQELKQCQEQK